MPYVRFCRSVIPFGHPYPAVQSSSLPALGAPACCSGRWSSCYRWCTPGRKFSNSVLGVKGRRPDVLWSTVRSSSDCALPARGILCADPTRATRKRAGAARRRQRLAPGASPCSLKRAMSQSPRQLQGGDAASVTLEQGDILGLIGPNGAANPLPFTCLTGDLAATSGRCCSTVPDNHRLHESRSRLGLARNLPGAQTFAGHVGAETRG